MCEEAVLERPGRQGGWGDLYFTLLCFVSFDFILHGELCSPNKPSEQHFHWNHNTMAARFQYVEVQHVNKNTKLCLLNLLISYMQIKRWSHHWCTSNEPFDCRQQLTTAAYSQIHAQPFIWQYLQSCLELFPPPAHLKIQADSEEYLHICLSYLIENKWCLKTQKSYHVLLPTCCEFTHAVSSKVHIYNVMYIHIYIFDLLLKFN